MLTILCRLAWAEILGWTQRRSLHAVLIGLVVLVVMSIAVGTQDLTSRQQDYRDQLATIAKEQVKPLLPMTGTAVERVLRVPRPAELGSLIARGEDGRLASYFDFGPGGLQWGRTVVSDASQVQAAAVFDVESIIRVIGGLIAVLLGIDVVGASRFRGQLLAWQALGLNPVFGVAGKLLGCAGVLVSGCAVVLGVASVAAGVRLHDQTSAIASLMAWSFVPSALYLCVLAAVGGAVALWCRSLATASIVGVAVWVTIAKVGPQVGGLGGRLLAPVTPRAEFERARDQRYAEDTRAAEEAMGDQLVEALATWTGRVPPLEMDAAVSQHRTTLESVWSAHVRAARDLARDAEREWANSRNRQIQIDRWLQFLTPGACFNAATAALSGTGRGLSRAWHAQAEAQQQQLAEALFDDRSLGSIRFKGQMAELPRHPTLSWSDLPAPPPLEIRSGWQDAREPLIALVVYLVLASLAIRAGARRLGSDI